MKYLLLILVTLSMLLSGCGKSAKSSFEAMAKDAENRLQLLNTSDTHTNNSYGNFRHEVQDNIGTLSFTYNLELDATDIGGGIIRTSFDWRAKYEFKDGQWQYVSSERQVHKLDGTVVWQNPRRDVEIDTEVLSILESLN